MEHPCGTLDKHNQFPKRSVPTIQRQDPSQGRRTLTFLEVDKCETEAIPQSGPCTRLSPPSLCPPPPLSPESPHPGFPEPNLDIRQQTKRVPSSSSLQLEVMYLLCSSGLSDGVPTSASACAGGPCGSSMKWGIGIGGLVFFIGPDDSLPLRSPHILDGKVWKSFFSIVLSGIRRRGASRWREQNGW